MFSLEAGRFKAVIYSLINSPMMDEILHSHVTAMLYCICYMLIVNSSLVSPVMTALLLLVGQVDVSYPRKAGKKQIIITI